VSVKQKGRGLKMNNKVGAAILGMLLVAAIGPAVAQESERGIYIGGSVGYSQYQNACDRALVPCDEGDTAGRFFAGYQFNRNWSAEIGVGRFGEASGSGTVVGGAGTGSFKLKSEGWDVTAVATIPLGSGLGVLGRLGVYRARTTLDQEGSFFAPMHDAGTQSGWTYGAGLSYTLGWLGLRAEWQRYDNIGADSIGDDEIDMFSLGVLFRF
jgi:OmpA-OmpF porin, OOP family